MRPAHTPSSVKGSISKCVVSLQKLVRNKRGGETKAQNNLNKSGRTFCSLFFFFLNFLNMSGELCDLTCKSCVHKERSDSRSPH